MGTIYTDILTDGFDEVLEKQRETLFSGVNKSLFDYNQALTKLLLSHNTKLHAGEKIDIDKLDAETRKEVKQLQIAVVENLAHAANRFLSGINTVA